MKAGKKKNKKCKKRERPRYNLTGIYGLSGAPVYIPRLLGLKKGPQRVTGSTEQMRFA